MAIYHLNVRGVSRARGSSAVRAAAYQSGDTIIDVRTGERCDYARKERVVASGIELPDGAPPALSDRASLWNAMERCVEGMALSARRIEFSLPRELDPSERESAVRAMAATFTAQGRAADWAIHDAGDGNPHAHMLVTGLPLSMEWDADRPEAAFSRPKEKRTEKHYLLRNAAGEERLAPSSEWKRAKADGWEKVFRYNVGGTEERLTQSQAKDRGLTNDDRASKQPVARAVRVNGAGDLEAAKEELRAIRADWAGIANAALADHAERTGTEAVAIDHRSNEERGVETVPMLHLGPKPSAGRAEENAAIASLNERIAAAVAEISRLAERARAWWSARADKRRRAAISRGRGIAMLSARLAAASAESESVGIGGWDWSPPRGDRPDPSSIARAAIEAARRKRGDDGPGWRMHI